MAERRVGGAGVSLAVAEAGAGSGRRPVLLLHGFTGAKEDWADWLVPLARAGWHAVAPDQRGHGRSDHPADPAEYALERFADDALALADALGWERFALVGISLGGVIAQLVALRAGSRLTALVLVDTMHGPVPLDRAASEAGIPVVERGGMDALAELVAGLGADSPLTTAPDQRLRRERPGYARYLDRNLRACSPVMWVRVLRELFDQPDRRRALGGLAVPTLVVVGQHDLTLRPDADRLAAAIPSARLAVVADAGHAPQFEAPAAWWEAVGAFLQEIEP